nr:MAG TPA: hypothetical protein [Caudoviricetes sp.]
MHVLDIACEDEVDYLTRSSVFGVILLEIVSC